MKTLLALIFAANMFAGTAPDYINTYYYDPSVSISFENWKEGSLSVKIISKDKTLVFNDKLDTRKSNGIRYNLKNLASGKYDIVLENNFKKVIETVILFDGKIVEKDALVYYKPSIQRMNDKIKVNFLSANGKVDVSIYNGQNTVYEEKFENANPMNKVFDISNLVPGTYTFTVRDEYTSRMLSFEI